MRARRRKIGSAEQAEETEALYQGKRLDDEQRDPRDLPPKTGRTPRMEPTYGLAIGDHQHRQLVAELYRDTRS